MNRSIFVIIARLIYDVTAVISIGRITRIILRHERLPGWILELVTVGKLAVMLAALFIVPASSPFLLALGLWFLIDEVNAWLRDVIISPLAEGDDHFTSNPPRWLLLNLVDTMIVPVAFAALFLYCGRHFTPAIDGAMTAIYQSTLTFTTLGYGDIHPVDSVGRLIVTVELMFFLTFVLIRVPLAVSVLKTRHEKKAGEKSDDAEKDVERDDDRDGERDSGPKRG